MIDNNKTLDNISYLISNGMYSKEYIIKYISISKQTYYRWLNKKSMPKLEHIFSLCNLYNIKYRDLVILKKD